MVGVACEEGRGDSVTLCALVEEGRKVWMVTTATLLTCIQFLLQDNLLDQVTKVMETPLLISVVDCVLGSWWWVT